MSHLLSFQFCFLFYFGVELSSRAIIPFPPLCVSGHCDHLPQRGVFHLCPVIPTSLYVHGLCAPSSLSACIASCPAFFLAYLSLCDFDPVFWILPCPCIALCDLFATLIDFLCAEPAFSKAFVPFFENLNCLRVVHLGLRLVCLILVSAKFKIRV